MKKLLLVIFLLTVSNTSLYAQCPTPINDGSMAFTGSADNPATSLAPFVNFGSDTAGADETYAFIYINTVNQFDIPSEITSLPPVTPGNANAFYNGRGQKLVANFAYEFGFQKILNMKDLEPSTDYYFQMVKVSRCGATYTINNSIVAAQNTGTTTGAGLLETNTAKDVVFGNAGNNNILLNSFTGVSQPNPATGYVIKMNTTNSFTPIAFNTDPSTLSGNTVYGGGEQTVYVGNSTSPNLDITGLNSDTQYYFKIYAYRTFASFGTNHQYQQTGHLAITSTATSKPQASITILGGVSINMTTSIDNSFPLIATTNSAASVIYQLVEAPYGTRLTFPSVTTGEAGTILIDIIAPGDATYSSNKERITITVNKATPSTTLNTLTVLPNSNTEIPFTTDSNGLITYSIVGATNGNSLSGPYNGTFTAGTTTGATLVRASVAASDYYEASTKDAYITIIKNEALFTTDSNLFSLSGGVATSLVDFTANPTNTGLSAYLIREIGDKLWGITFNGGIHGKGVVYMVDKDGSNFVKIADLNSSTTGAVATSIQETNGTVYGVNLEGGTSGKGQIWSANTDGTGFSIIHTFTNAGLQKPIGELVVYNGKLYGVTSEGGTNAAGGVFSIDYDGSNYTEEFSMTTSNGGFAEFGATLFNNLLWWTSDNKVYGWSPVTKTITSVVTMQASFNFEPVVVEGEMYVVNSQYIEKITTANTTSIVHTFSGVDPQSSPFYDGTRLWGTGRNNGFTYPVVYSMLLNGTDFRLEWQGTVSEFPGGNVLRFLEKETPIIDFTDQTVDHLSVTTLSGISSSTSPLTYELINDTTGASLNGNQFTAGNAGTVTIRASVAANNNFEAATVDATFTIQKLDPTFVISDLSLQLDQSPFTIIPDETNYTGGTITYQFVDPSDTNNLSSSGFNTTSFITGDQLTLAGIGTETIRATLPESTNFNAKTVDFQLTTQGGVADLSGFVDFTVELFQNDVILSVPSAPGVAVSYELLTSNTAASLSGLNNSILSIGNTTGTETIRVTVIEPDFAPATKDVILTIERATPVITWATPADIQGYIEPLDAARLNASANIPGTFEYRVDGVLITEGVTTINAVGARTLVAHFTPTDIANYQETTFSVVINATQVNLEITLDNKNITVGDAEPTLTYTITNGSIIPGHTLFLPITRETGNTAGTYAITVDNTVQSPQEDSDGNPVCPNGLCIYGPHPNFGTDSYISSYNITIIDGTFTIGSQMLAPEDFIFNAPASLEYDATEKIVAVTAVNTLNPPLSSEDIDVTYEGRNGTAYASNTAAPVNFGDYTVTATVNDANTDYDGTATFDFSITKRPIEVTADAITKLETTTDPPLTYTIINGSLAGSDAFTGSLERAPGEAVGSYPISQGTLALTDNYILTFIGANFTIDTAIPAKALHFNGSVNNTYDYITVPDSNDLDFSTSYTFEAWINFDQTSVSNAGYGWRALHAKSRYADSYGLMIYAPSGLTRFYHKGMGIGYTDYTWSNLQTGVWYHIAVTLSATEAKIYIDGVEVSTNTFTAGTLVTNNEPLHIGSSRVVTGDPYPFDGKMDEVRFWNTTRTQEEINNGKNYQLNGDEAGLVLNYRFDQGFVNEDNTGITSVIDNSTQNNHGTLNNFALTGAESNFTNGFTILSKQDQVITFNALADVEVNDPTFDLTATSDSGLTVTYVSSNPAVATISGSTVTIVGEGTTNITASQSGNYRYNAAMDVVQSLTVTPPGLAVSPKVFLQGAALNPNTGEENLMRDDLRGTYIPLRSPYPDMLASNSTVFNDGGTSTTGATQDNIVDWVYVELRSGVDNTAILEAQSALLQRDGDVVAADGISTIKFNMPAGDYYLAIKHRNHLGIITNSTVNFQTGMTTVIDFTDQANQITFGTNAQTAFGMPTGKIAMWTGNVNNDTIVQYSGTTPDTPNILSEVLNDPSNFLNFPTYIVNAYLAHDINLDGNIQYSGTNPDTPFILQNVLAHPGNFLNFSTYQILEQLPEN